jgi:hypothetical protein
MQIYLLLTDSEGGGEQKMFLLRTVVNSKPVMGDGREINGFNTIFVLLHSFDKFKVYTFIE